MEGTEVDSPGLDDSIDSARDVLEASFGEMPRNLSTKSVAGSDHTVNTNRPKRQSKENDKNSADIHTPTLSNGVSVLSTGNADTSLQRSSGYVTSFNQSVSICSQDENESMPQIETDIIAAASGSGSETDLEDNTNTEDADDYFDDDLPGTWDEKFRQKRRNLEAQLPATVTKLRTAEGCEVYLVGTAHFSLESQEDVAKTIQATQPDVVVVELCRGRANILQLDEETVLEEAKNLNFNKIHLTMKQNGLVQGLMYLFLLNMSAHLTKQLGMAPGGEFRRAFAEAMKVRGCVVRLGDRPIQITLQRALSELSLWQKLCLAWCMLTSKDPISKEEVEKCKQRDLLEEMLNEMTGKFPALSRVFVKERDIYLAHSLELASTSIPCIHSKSGCLPTVVVGVVGIGHVSGIVQHWGKVSAEDIPPLLIIPETSLSTKIAKWTMKASMMSGIAYCCFKVLARPAVINIVSKVSRSLFK